MDINIDEESKLLHIKIEIEDEFNDDIIETDPEKPHIKKNYYEPTCEVDIKCEKEDDFNEESINLAKPKFPKIKRELDIESVHEGPKIKKANLEEPNFFKSLHKCFICAFNFFTAEDFINHFKFNHSISQYVEECVNCKYPFKAICKNLVAQIYSDRRNKIIPDVPGKHKKETNFRKLQFEKILKIIFPQYHCSIDLKGTLIKQIVNNPWRNLLNVMIQNRINGSYHKKIEHTPLFNNKDMEKLMDLLVNK